MKLQLHHFTQFFLKPIYRVIRTINSPVENRGNSFDM